MNSLDLESTMQEQNSRDFKWALGLNKWGAELLGVWPNEELVAAAAAAVAGHRHSSSGGGGGGGGGRTEGAAWYVRLRVPFMITLMLLWICLPQTWALVLVIDNLSLVIDNLMSNSAAFAGSIKLFFLWRSKEVMQPVVGSARSDWLRAKSPWEREFMLRRASSMRLVTALDCTLTGLSVLGFIALPLVLGVDVRQLNNITDRPAAAAAERHHLLVQSYYPLFDYSASPYFELSLGLQCLGALFTALAITVPENYFGALVLHTSGQFEILARGLEGCFDADATAATVDEARLANLIRRHVHLVARMVRALERSFTYVTLAQIFSTSVILCSYGFQFLAIIGASDQDVSFLQIVSLLCIMFTLMVHTLLDCVVGETLAMRIDSLSYSIYKCRWYEPPQPPLAAGSSSARDLVPMMIMSRTQKPLTAGKIMSLSLATYCSILKTTAGYISMLVAVNTK